MYHCSWAHVVGKIWTFWLALVFLHSPAALSNSSWNSQLLHQFEGITWTACFDKNLGQRSALKVDNSNYRAIKPFEYFILCLVVPRRCLRKDRAEHSESQILHFLPSWWLYNLPHIVIPWVFEREERYFSRRSAVLLPGVILINHSIHLYIHT